MMQRNDTDTKHLTITKKLRHTLIRTRHIANQNKIL